MALVNYQAVLYHASKAGSGIGQTFGVASQAGNGIIAALQYDDLSATVSSVSDQINGAYIHSQGPNRLAYSTTYAFYLPANSANAVLNISLALSGTVFNLQLGIIEYVAPALATLSTQAASDVPTQLADIYTYLRTLSGR